MIAYANRLRSDAFGQRLDTNAAVLPNSLARSIRRRFKGFPIRINAVQCVRAVCWISKSILKL